MTYLIIFCAVILFIAIALVIYRIAKGPTTLDRIVAVDMATSILIGALALVAAYTRRVDLLPAIAVLAIVGFIGSTTIARFAQPLPPALRKQLKQLAQERVESYQAQSQPETDHHKGQKFDGNEEGRSGL